MRRASLVFLAANVLVAFAGSRASSAQDAPKHPIQFIINGGLTVPAGDLKDYNELGFHAAGSMLFRFAGFPLALRPELSLTRLKQKVPTFEGFGRLGTGTTTTESLETTQLLGLMGNIELPLLAGLYVLAGVGAMNLDTSVESQTNVTLNAGAGWRFQIGRIGGFVEARFGSASYDGATFGYSSAQFIPVSLGLIF